MQWRCPTPFAADSGFAAPSMRREPAKSFLDKGVLPAPPLPLKPTVISANFRLSHFGLRLLTWL
jgi:hypothetical protein